IFFFFFFQAEDGIRDFHVTGVQTCALPISAIYGPMGCCLRNLKASSCRDRSNDHNLRSESVCARRNPRRKFNFEESLIVIRAVRSEERRVGKECRSRWWREQ